MPWTAFIADDFEPEIDAPPQVVQDAILARPLLLMREAGIADGLDQADWSKSADTGM